MVIGVYCKNISRIKEVLINLFFKCLLIINIVIGIVLRFGDIMLFIIVINFEFMGFYFSERERVIYFIVLYIVNNVVTEKDKV